MATATRTHLSVGVELVILVKSAIIVLMVLTEHADPVARDIRFTRAPIAAVRVKSFTIFL